MSDRIEQAMDRHPKGAGKETMKLIEKNGRTYIQAKTVEIEYTDSVSRHIIRAAYHMENDSNMAIREVLDVAGAAGWEAVDCLRWLAGAETGDVWRRDNGQCGLTIKCVNDSDTRQMSSMEAAAYRKEDLKC